MSEEDDLLAAELALGLIDDREALARLAQDAALAERTAWWQEQLAGLTAPLSQEPPADLWPRIAAALPQNDNSRSVWPWKLVSGAMTLVAVAALVMVAQRPQLVLPPPPGAPAVASLSGETGNALTIAYETGSRRITIAPVKLDPGKGDAELWVIPVGAEVPISLGVIDASKPSSQLLDPVQAQLVAAGATFAISLEPTGGSPTGKPTGPIVASGKLIEI
jgi:anti-sigma-K factor RskA